MDKKRKDTLILFIFSVFVAMVWLFYAQPKTDFKVDVKPSVLDLVFWFAGVVGIIILPVTVKRFIGGGMHG